MVKAKIFQISVLIITAIIFFGFLFYFDFFKPVKIIIGDDLPASEPRVFDDKLGDVAVEAAENSLNKRSNQPDEYEPVKQISKTCSKRSDCVLPMEYSVKSDCPYEMRCLDDVCTIVCPAPFASRGIATTTKGVEDD
jgi:hypothetical protein